jgi:hypothetical protein
MLPLEKTADRAKLCSCKVGFLLLAFVLGNMRIRITAQIFNLKPIYGFLFPQHYRCPKTIDRQCIHSAVSKKEKIMRNFIFGNKLFYDVSNRFNRFNLQIMNAILPMIPIVRASDSYCKGCLQCRIGT